MQEFSYSTIPRPTEDYNTKNVATSSRAKNVNFTLVQPSILSSPSTLSTETCSETGPPYAKSKVRYSGDVRRQDLKTAVVRRKAWRVLQTTISNQKKKIRMLQQKTRRLKMRIVSLNSLTKYLKDKGFISDNAETIIKAATPGLPEEFFQRFLAGSSNQKYGPKLRAFALTLHFYSPKAYNFVRETFNNSLPHPKSIQKWFQSVDGAPGFTTEALNALRIKVEEADKRGGKVLCNLVLDEMAIRKKVEWTGSTVEGYVDVDTGVHNDALSIAKEALVFMLVAINGEWKVPIAYFFIDSLTASEKASLLLKSLELTHPTGVIVTSITFDGTATNLSMCSHLGASLDYENLKPFFSHPVTKNKVFVFMDACHMVKLVRNCLGSQRTLQTDEGVVDWRYLEELVHLQNVEGLHAGTKLRNRHIHWAQEKMRVKLAAQTFSKSVSDALLFLCNDLKLQNFSGVEETAKFLLIFNNIFDILNSRSRFAKYSFQKPLSPATKDNFFTYMNESIDYIKHLKLKGTPVLCSARKTGFLGFIVCATNLMEFYKMYVEEQHLLKYVLSYKFSQDHIEIFFSIVRSRGGYNNNPTCKQFQATFKKLLIHAEIKGATTANAVALDSTSILQCASKSTLRKSTISDALIFNDDVLIDSVSLDHDYLLSHQPWDLTEYVNDIVAYISGFIVKCLKKEVQCSTCIKYIEAKHSPSLLQTRKEYKQLTRASKFIHSTCIAAEKELRMQKAANEHYIKQKNIKNILINNTFNKIPRSTFDIFGDHFWDGDLFNNHPIGLIKLVLGYYFNIRLHYECSKIENKVTKIRSRLTKTILFSHQ